MMTLIEQPERMFSADLPEEVRKRADAARGRSIRRQALPRNPKLTYAEPQNCILHFLAPSHEVRPSFATIVGLSLCSECALDVAEEVIAGNGSARELIALATHGNWVD